MPAVLVATMLRNVAVGNIPVTKLDPAPTPFNLTADYDILGFKIRVFFDCGEADYIEQATDPFGGVTTFCDWFDAAVDADECEPIGMLSRQEVAALEVRLKGATA